MPSQTRYMVLTICALVIATTTVLTRLEDAGNQDVGFFLNKDNSAFNQALLKENGVALSAVPSSDSTDEVGSPNADANSLDESIDPLRESKSSLDPTDEEETQTADANTLNEGTDPHEEPSSALDPTNEEETQTADANTLNEGTDPHEETSSALNPTDGEEAQNADANSSKEGTDPNEKPSSALGPIEEEAPKHADAKKMNEDTDPQVEPSSRLNSPSDDNKIENESENWVSSKETKGTIQQSNRLILSPVIKSQEPIFIFMDWGYNSYDFVTINFRSLESILGVYPNAKVRVVTTGPTYAWQNHFGNSLPVVFLQKYAKRGYDVKVEVTNTRDSGLERRMDPGAVFFKAKKKEHFWAGGMSHGAFVSKKNVIPAYFAVAFLRFAVLYEHGGIFADFTTLFTKPLPKNTYGYSIKPECSTEQTSGKKWPQAVMYFEKRSPILKCVLERYDAGVVEACARREGGGGGALCVQQALGQCEEEVNFVNRLEDSEAIKWFNCKASEVQQALDSASSTDLNLVHAIQDQKVSAFWLGPNATSGLWLEPHPGSIGEIALQHARASADRWDGRQNDPSCPTVCSRYDTTSHKENSKEILAGKANCAPGVIVPGTQKGASTFLFHAISSHPQVLQPLRGAHGFKETGRYMPDKGFGDFKLGVRVQGFPYIEEDENFISGDGTVIYMSANKKIAEYVYRDNPNCKIVFALRNPTERAFSDYRFMYHAFKSQSFNSIASSAIPELKPCFDHFQNHWAPGNQNQKEYEQKGIDTFYSGRCGRSLGHGLVKKGLYYFQVLHFINIFGRENVMVVDAGEMKRDQRTVLNRLVKFLGLCEYDYSQLRGEENVTPVKVRDAHKMTAETHQALQHFFEPFNQRLYRLMAIDYGWEGDTFKVKK